MKVCPFVSGHLTQSPKLDRHLVLLKDSYFQKTFDVSPFEYLTLIGITSVTYRLIFLVYISIHLKYEYGHETIIMKKGCKLNKASMVLINLV